MRQVISWSIASICLAVLGVVLGCVTQKAALKVKNSLPQERLAQYNDSFDRIQWDLWEEAGIVYSEAQMENYKPADIRAENGEVVIVTRTGCFSKGGLGSKYSIRGDFDIQLDCRMDFPQGPQDVDQIATFVVFQKGQKLSEINSVQIGLSGREGLVKRYLFFNYLRDGANHLVKALEIDGFQGTFRLVRIGDQVAGLYKTREDTDWKELGRAPLSSEEVLVGFKVQNFLVHRTHLKASVPVKGVFDNFRINAAEEVIESEI